MSQNGSPSRTPGRSNERPPLRSSKTETKIRGRSRQTRQSTKTSNNPVSWIRSASTSSILKLRRPDTTSSSSSSSLHPDTSTLPSNQTHASFLRSPKVPSSSQSPSPLNTRRGRGRGNHSTSVSMERGISSPTRPAQPNTPAVLTEDSQSVVVDVLPSFEMYNALHRHIPQGNVNPDDHDFPPTYLEVQSQCNSTFPIMEQHSTDLSTAHHHTNHNHQNPPHSTHTNQHLEHSDNPINNLLPLTTQHLSMRSNHINQHHEDSIITSSSRTTSANVSGTTTPTNSQIPFQDDLNDSGNIFIDKLYTLPKLTTPVEIDIRLTKQASKPMEKPDEESILREFTSGDIIHGYCIIENRSENPLPFEMFYVTLEAYTSVIDKTKGKRTVKRFLRMVDLSASWSYTNIDLGTGFKMNPGERDWDDSLIGLLNNRILEPGIKYKKYFMFKFPNQLLDVTCKQEHFTHCLLPPSFGIDKYRNNCKYASIRVNHLLGSGHLGTKGSPILTYDMVDDNLSINYTIDARTVGKDIKTKKLIIMKEREYNLRFIPFSFASDLVGERDPIKQLKDLTDLIEDRLNSLKKIFDRLEKKEPIHNADIHGTDLSGTIDIDTELNSDEILQRKLNQLHLGNRLTDASRVYNSDSLSDFKSLTPREKKYENEQFVESELNYKIKGKHKSNSKIGLFASFRTGGSNLVSTTTTPTNTVTNATSALHHVKSSTNLKDSQLLNNNDNPVDHRDDTQQQQQQQQHAHVAQPPIDKIGLILLQAKIPKDSLPYWAPSILRKTNRFEAMTKHAQENWTNLINYTPEDKLKPLEKIAVDLTCIQSNNSLIHTPPEIQAITTELIAITAKSDNSIPIKFNAQMLMNDIKLKEIKAKFHGFKKLIRVYEKKFNDNLLNLNELYNMHEELTRVRQIKFSDFISTQLYNDVESLSNLNVKVDHISDIFKKQLSTLKAPEEYLQEQLQYEQNHSTTGIPRSLSGTTLKNNSNSNNASNSSNMATNLDLNEKEIPIVNAKGGLSSSATMSRNTTANKFQNQIIRSWVKKSQLEWKREINVNLKFNKDSIQTLVPSFESCLCCRFYCVRINVKFHNIGSAIIDVPITVKNLSKDYERNTYIVPPPP
ncbi:ubiquitin-ubiquitin ligase BUL1 NDAI_0K00450 [Naumovozyma dairenensis CBS 421]|uniref:BUL2 n=1 Tax=Naumovozyma dairenensis (strain ATCC 10597 / BCRC 20456 / CBS 421 / NBRC 0211 / NRRL Y-12639) TaxID=1071378 RepID=G0WHH5_NAUDC|nr:hypothetical protein NDAI_0K00450 [Naumovozyma dairenensis CBS 421]CCD27236.1 hypothetical protein NDAI_0K00450 [Naumovozyma dairenensis CBS 421]